MKTAAPARKPVWMSPDSWESPARHFGHRFKRIGNIVLWIAVVFALLWTLEYPRQAAAIIGRVIDELAAATH